MHNTRLIVQSIMHRSQEEVLLCGMLQLGESKKKKKSQEGSNLKINARAVIAHYISETVNMTEILIALNTFFYSFEDDQTDQPPCNCGEIITIC